MTELFFGNPATSAITASVALALALAVLFMIRRRRRGGHISCGGDCENCPSQCSKTKKGMFKS